MVAYCRLTVWVLTHAHSPSLEIFAFFMLTGVFSTMLIPETSHKSLEVISNESQDDFIQGMLYGHGDMSWSFSSRARLQLSRPPRTAQVTSETSKHRRSC